MQNDTGQKTKSKGKIKTGRLRKNTVEDFYKGSKDIRARWG